MFLSGVRSFRVLTPLLTLRALMYMYYIFYILRWVISLYFMKTLPRAFIIALLHEIYPVKDARKKFYFSNKNTLSDFYIWKRAMF